MPVKIRLIKKYNQIADDYHLLLTVPLSYIYDKGKEKIMAAAKKEDFKTEDIWLADIAKALSHPARISIMKILTDMNVCMCGDIVELLPLSQSTVSQHLKELKRVGLIQGDINGSKVCYCINNKTLQKAKREFDKLFNKICSC
ncbi:MAG: metalloregulator ArsR/SmtB family transcription factor [Ignavibacterium sp.]|nr:metalloregulator ArsR/SmtB family transcription factor [Ignavibacterium sp.]